MPKLNREWSLELGRTVGAEVGACWKNASLAVAALHGQGLGEGVTYVEGYVVGPFGLVFEHGWVEVGDDLIDPTIASWASDHEPMRSYHAGLRYNLDELMRLLPRIKDTLPTYELTGMGAEIFAAQQAAYAFLGIPNWPPAPSTPPPSQATRLVNWLAARKAARATRKAKAAFFPHPQSPTINGAH